MNSNLRYRITDLDVNERPRERLARLGAEALSSAELLAILIRVGVQGENAVQVGHRLLQKFGGLRGLQKATVEDIQANYGVGPAKAAQIKAAIELGRRLASETEKPKQEILSPDDAAKLVMYEMSALEKEHLRVILLNTRNQVIDIVDIYKGAVNSAQVRIAEVFMPAIKRNAPAIIVVHNHPSGNPKPSADDVAITMEIVKSGDMLGVKVLDHLIIGGGRYVSLKEEKLGFN